MAQVTTGSTVHDVVVIGSGAGGGVLAGTLTELMPGKQIVVAEKGGHYGAESFTQREWDARVMYADKGTMTFILTDDEIAVDVADEGPGIPDIDLAMQPGYSTASDEMRELGFGYGLGLPNIKKNSDAFVLESEVGKGTRLYSSIRLDSNG